ncbi:MAG TPA: hypothetical protein VH107_09385 [Lacipirellulaceae bacterium]|nr:hypothetical protein [Lacipirellulaceae bacterium]
MLDYRSLLVKTSALSALLFTTAIVLAENQKPTEGLTEFKSDPGKFSIRLPGKPQQEDVEVGTAKEKQHQFTVGMEKGAYIISYQENPNLKNSSPQQIAAALESGRDRLKEVFHGKLVESKATTLNKTSPGLNFRLEMAEPKGEARCRFYMVGTRLYEIIVIGEPAFANSTEATQVIDSFKLLK